MGSLRLKYMVDDYRELSGKPLPELPLLRIKYMVPDYKQLDRNIFLQKLIVRVPKRRG